MSTSRSFVARARQFTHATVALAVLVSLMASAQPSSAASRVTTFHTFDTEHRAVALTFDVTFDRGDAAMILNTLANRNVVATFAITGRWAQDNPDLLRRMVNDGHQLMNHTWDHFSFTGQYTGSVNIPPRAPLSHSQVVNQITRTHNLVQQITGVDMRPYIRPPYGDYNLTSLGAMADAGYHYNIMWTVDTLGWHLLPVSTVQQRALNAARPGANILMHVGHGATDGAALPGIIDGYRAMGYEFGTVEDFVEGRYALPRVRYFPETDQELTGGFLRYWERFGGLSLFGYPISGEFEEDGMTVQYFERARFELQPGTWPERYDVHLTRLGAEAIRGRHNEDPFQPVEAESDDHCTYFPQTGHTLCHGFRDYWEQFGGLAVYGYPMSREFREFNRDTGEMHVVQYFERQRFEWHPGKWPERHDVLLGRLGSEEYAQRE
jgi:peptidoglycan/xylan/chitin deacetylase (PgdA/CDA1 family)